MYLIERESVVKGCGTVMLFRSENVEVFLFNDGAVV